MSRRTILLFASAILAVASPCLAVVEMPPDSNGATQAVPDTFVLRDGREWLIWVAYEGYRPKTRWSEAARPEGDRTLEFMESFHVLYSHKGKEGAYLLLGKSDPTVTRVQQVIGWVRKDFTVESEAERVPPFRFHRKVLLVAGANILATNEDRWAGEIPVFDAPWSGARVRAKFMSPSIFFCYGRSALDRSGTGDEGYVLIGSAPYLRPSRWDGEESPTRVVMGWAPRSRIVFWNTRLAVAWDRASTLVHAEPRRANPSIVFDTPKAAIDFLDDATTIDSDHALFRERFDDSGQSIRFEPYHMRYPILEWETDELTLPNGGKLSRKQRANELLKIGCFGDFSGRSLREEDEDRRRREYYKKMLSTLEILFVIDDTGGMDRHFGDIARLVQGVCRNAHKTTPTVRVAVAFYNDTSGNPSGWNPVSLPRECFPLRTIADDGRKMADIVKEHHPVPGGDPLELVFRGVKQAIEKATFSPWARKVVIVIGDCGDREDDPKDLNEQSIARRLLPRHGDFVEFYAVQVCDPMRDRHTRLFQDQMRTIVSLVNEWGNEVQGTNKYLAKGTLARYLQAKDGNLVEMLNVRRAEIARYATDYRPRPRRAFPTEIGPAFDRILENWGVDVPRLRAKEDARLFHEGFVWRYAPGAIQGVPQVRVQAMLDRRTIEDIVDLFERLLRRRDSIFGGTVTLERVLMELVAALTGEDPDERLSFEALVYRRLGLSARSPLLKKAIGTPTPLRLAQDELTEIERRINVLRDILNGVQRDWMLQERMVGGMRTRRWVAAGEARRYDRSFTLPGSTVKWYWIDVQGELP